MQPTPELLGRRYAPDARDQRHTMRSLMAWTRPTLPLFRFWLPGPITEQTGPHCVGHAWWQYLTASPLRTVSGPPPRVIYEEAQRVDEWDGENYDGTSVRAGAKVIEASGYITEYVWAHDGPTVRDWILGHGPVVLGTDWTNDMFDPDAEGYLHPSGGSVGGHAYVATGYSAKRRAFRIVNSWGTAWGDAGRAWIREGDMDSLIRGMGEACAAIQVRL